jgi:hypothetical protein
LNGIVLLPDALVVVTSLLGLLLATEAPNGLIVPLPCTPSTCSLRGRISLLDPLALPLATAPNGIGAVAPALEIVPTAL